MNNKQLIIIVIAVIVGACIISGTLIYCLSNPVENETPIVVNNTTNITENETEIYEDTSQNTESSDSDIVTDENGITYNKKTGICTGQAEGQKYSEVKKMYDSSSPTACPHGMADPSYCPACS